MSNVRQALAAPPIRRYLSSVAASSVGIQLLITVLFKQAFDITGDELSIGLIGLAQFIPGLLLVLVSGYVADRFDRRRVTALFIGGRALCAIALVAYSIGDSGALWPLLAIAFVFGASDAMMMPSSRSITPLIATGPMFPQVIALWTVVHTGSSIVGPVLGGFTYSVAPELAYAIATGLFLLATIPMLRVQYVKEPEPMLERPTVSMALDGLNFVRRTPIVLGSISLDLFAVLFGGAVALIPAVAAERLGVGDIAYGWLRAAPGIGAAAMAVLLAIRPLRRRVGPTLLIVVAIFGVATVVFGLTRNYVVAFGALIVLAAADMVSVFVRSSIVPLATPEHQLGRVSAVESVFIGASNELGAFESGVAARYLGVPFAIAGGGVATIVVAGLFAVLFPSIRRIDTFEELQRN